MGSYPKQPTNFEHNPERPDSSDRFYLEKLIDYYNARRMFVRRARWARDVQELVPAAQGPPREGPLEVAGI